jgi:hypothetical protein
MTFFKSIESAMHSSYCFYLLAPHYAHTTTVNRQ